MSNKNKVVAGSLLFVGGILYILGAVIGEKFSNNLVVNASVFLLGVFMIVGVYFVQKAFRSVVFSATLALAGIGSIGVGVFQNGSTIYYAFAGIGYVFFAISAIWSYKFEKKPLSYFSVVLGVLSLVALFLWAFGIDLGSGVKLSPLIIDDIVLLWLISFGAHIIGDSGNASEAK
jgi:hypothetical membrane protein